MAIGATCVWEVRSTATASNANGGGYTSGGVDYSQQNAAQYNLTGVTTAAADAILLHASAASDMVGNIANITGGTNFTVGRYEILSVVVGVSITLDRTCTTAAGSAGVVNIGGAISLGSSDDAFFESLVAGNTVHVKAGTYTIGGAVSMTAAGTAALPIEIIGYNAARNDTPGFASQPLLAFAANTSLFGAYVNFYNFNVTTTSVYGFNIGTASLARNCKSTNSSVSAGRQAIFGNSANLVFGCEAVSTVGEALRLADDNGKAVGNYLHDSTNGIVGTTSPIGMIILGNIVDNCTASAINTGSTSNSVLIANNTLYGNPTPAGTGIAMPATTGRGCVVINNIISNFAIGIDSNTSAPSNFFDYNNFFNNTTNRTNVNAGPNDTALDPGFTDAANGNFTIGANLKAKGFPGAFPGGLTTGYLDIGAVQRVEPTGGGLLTNPGMSGGLRG